MESHCGYTISEILLSFYHVHTDTAAMFCASPNVFCRSLLVFPVSKLRRHIGLQYDEAVPNAYAC